MTNPPTVVFQGHAAQNGWVLPVNYNMMSGSTKDDDEAALELTLWRGTAPIADENCQKLIEEHYVNYDPKINNKKVCTWAESKVFLAANVDTESHKKLHIQINDTMWNRKHNHANNEVYEIFQVTGDTFLGIPPKAFMDTVAFLADAAPNMLTYSPMHLALPPLGEPLIAASTQGLYVAAGILPWMNHPVGNVKPLFLTSNKVCTATVNNNEKKMPANLKLKVIVNGGLKMGGWNNTCDLVIPAANIDGGMEDLVLGLRTIFAQAECNLIKYITPHISAHRGDTLSEGSACGIVGLYPTTPGLVWRINVSTIDAQQYGMIFKGHWEQPQMPQFNSLSDMSKLVYRAFPDTSSVPSKSGGRVVVTAASAPAEPYKTFKWDNVKLSEFDGKDAEHLVPSDIAPYFPIKFPVVSNNYHFKYSDEQHNLSMNGTVRAKGIDLTVPEKETTSDVTVSHLTEASWGAVFGILPRGTKA